MLRTKLAAAAGLLLASIPSAFAQGAGDIAGFINDEAGGDRLVERLQPATVALVDASGGSVGSVELVPVATGVLLRFDLTGLPPGELAVHIHQNGRCAAPFASAGDHFNPERKLHGFLSNSGPHAGDMPNLAVPEGGSLKVDILNTLVTLAADQPNSLRKEGGTAIIIHEGPDDYSTNPAGDAGDRIACGVIE